MERPSTELPCLPVAFSLPEGTGFLISASLADRGRVRCRDSVKPDFPLFLSQLTLKKKLHSNSRILFPAESTLQSTAARIHNSTLQLLKSPHSSGHKVWVFTFLVFNAAGLNSGISASIYTPGPFQKNMRHMQKHQSQDFIQKNSHPRGTKSQLHTHRPQIHLDSHLNGTRIMILCSSCVATLEEQNCNSLMR